MTPTLTMDQPTTGAPAVPPARSAPTPARPTGVRRVLAETGYALASLPLGIASFVAAVALIAVGAGLSVILGGVLVLSLAVLVARGFARIERFRIRNWLGRPAPEPAYLRSQPDDGFWRRHLTPLRDPQSWLDTVGALVALFTGIAAFVTTVVWWAAALGGLTYWFWQQWIPYDPDDNVSLAELIGLGEGRTPESWLMLGIGILAVLTLPWVVRLVAVVHSSIAVVLLSSRAELQGQVARVAGTRDAARLAEASSLRRLERDIHDGPQQRLVRLTMDLGRAKAQIGDDPAKAGATLDGALRQARETVDELRSLSRGIAPPLLVDRGLVAAVDEMAAGCPVPVTTSLDVPADLPPHVETAAYFVVAEALTNVAKHSGAARARVTVVTRRGAVELEVHDDGVGGAHPGKGLGLAGLGQRVAAADGDLEVTSPTDGPTVVRARLPLREDGP